MYNKRMKKNLKKKKKKKKGKKLAQTGMRTSYLWTANPLRICLD
jgi:hypothetical protein